ncbi:ABC transporter substrate-binding protein [Tamilnaduibacter salinus]|uniref:ABC transporter substrate-binding protein n=1 Tax=Tamilnaduibacter salinus TaxID=1484056 RepID=A0A2A2I3J9_9GAMM|nr:TRAP transporter substrate-binding protein [Tamilnaduibacter salinus]PAV25978.1 ABC transporter substrate-binding protein [Tamilnaduibacter salinus]
MTTRVLMTSLLVGSLSLGLAGCSGGADNGETTGSNQSSEDGTTSTEMASGDSGEKTYEWKLVTTWPKNFPGLGTAPERLADNLREMTDGQIDITVYGAGDLVPALEVFSAVSQGTAEMGHGAGYYWKGKVPAAQFFSTVPFGLTAQEYNGWMFYGGGLELYREAYEPFGVIPWPGGNTGVQMGGWFNKEINSVEDLKGLKMRIPGIGGDVLEKAGGTPVNLPGGEIFTALQTGTIDATEWVGPYNDLSFGLHQIAEYYYYPGWHEPGTALELIVNEEAYNSLPDHLQKTVDIAVREMNADMLAEYTARNNEALKELVDEKGVKLRRFPDDALKRLRNMSEEAVKALAEKDDMAAKAYESYKSFRDKVVPYTEISEQTYIEARSAE